MAVSRAQQVGSISTSLSIYNLSEYIRWPNYNYLLLQKDYKTYDRTGVSYFTDGERIIIIAYKEWIKMQNGNRA